MSIYTLISQMLTNGFLHIIVNIRSLSAFIRLHDFWAAQQPIGFGDHTLWLFLLLAAAHPRGQFTCLSSFGDDAPMPGGSYIRLYTHGFV